MGAWKSISGSTNIDTPSTQRTILFPVNLGFKYNLSGSWNVFTELTYRFTNSDKIDYFSDMDRHIPSGSTSVFQASSSGKDQYFSTKLGISYNLLKVYGLGTYKDPKKRDNIFRGNANKQSGNSFFNRFFGFFKRK